MAIIAQEERAVESELAKNELIKVSASANEDTFDHVKQKIPKGVAKTGSKLSTGTYNSEKKTKKKLAD